MDCSAEMVSSIDALNTMSTFVGAIPAASSLLEKADARDDGAAGVKKKC